MLLTDFMRWTLHNSLVETVNRNETLQQVQREDRRSVGGEAHHLDHTRLCLQQMSSKQLLLLKCGTVTDAKEHRVICKS